MGDENFTIELSSSSLDLVNSEQRITFKLSLNLIITWIFYGDKIIGFKIENLQIDGATEDMIKLKMSLGCLVSFKGILKFYTFQQTIYLNKNNVTKICQLRSNRNFRIYACKCYKKCNRSIESIHDEINLLLKLQGHRFISMIYEVYESESCIYLIMEHLYRYFDDDFTDEEVKIIVYVNFIITQELALNNQKTRKSVHSSQEQLVKTNRISNAVLQNTTNHEFELDIFKVGTLIYQRNNQDDKEQSPEIPDSGSDLMKNLLENQQYYRFNIASALQHPYFNSLNGDGIEQCKFHSMNPKFKDKIDETLSFQTKTFENTLLSQIKQQYFPGDLSTELQN
ncbi:unnamed protein product (macronuclear) [Paramecium tetraurelia]|uniref:Protein kinase domain-containing protein n=1 Tax=Paramecium tetraurelia TaxID=5888 RepID=A0EGW7_PARTE|nr:uncharacterized protein GSPATT00026882001 [Paramecium tetraurelia]CAK94558.1 unnamed protein product [Paramecium tetraurelia]|eukprot:XP_001461931.1 hypothetical protein (macronuclear) [Paramecium tetraurelia strain d4-2]